MLPGTQQNLHSNGGFGSLTSHPELTLFLAMTDNVGSYTYHVYMTIWEAEAFLFLILIEKRKKE